MEVKWLRNLGIVFLLFVIYLIPRTFINFPLSLTEAKESYSAFALTSPQFWFPTDNNFISPIGVYLRVPFVKGGIDYLSVRIPTIAMGFLVLIVFYLFTNNILKSKILALVASSLLAFSPRFIYISIFDISALVGMLFVLFCVTYKKPKIVILIAGAVLAFLFTQSNFRSFLLRGSIFYNSLPSQTSYIIDHKLSTGMLLDSPLVTPGFNFTRIAYNKAFFAIEGVIKNTVAAFDFEKLFSPKEAITILQKVDKNSAFLPVFHIWELPLIVIGLLVSFSQIPKNIKWLGVFVIFGWQYILPLLIFIEIYAFKWLWDKQKVVIVGLGAFFTAGVIIFVQTFVDYKTWMKPTEIAQQEIWQKVSPEKVRSKQIFVTDRIGESVYYYLAYHNVSPSVEKIARPHLDQGLVRIEKVGNIHFSSFEFDEAKAAPQSIWIGKEEEFRDRVSHQEIFSGLWLVCNKCQ